MTALHPETGVPSQPVALRVVPSRRFPGPLPAARVEAGDPVTGRLVVDATHSALSPHLRHRDVAVHVGGRRWTCPWGRTVIDLPAGRHLVEIEVDHGAGWGRVSEAVPVAAGSGVAVFYRAPVLPRAAGMIGPTPHRGAEARAVLLAALAGLTGLLAVALVLLAVLAAVAGTG